RRRCCRCGTSGRSSRGRTAFPSVRCRKSTAYCRSPSHARSRVTPGDAARRRAPRRYRRPVAPLGGTRLPAQGTLLPGGRIMRSCRADHRSQAMYLWTKTFHLLFVFAWGAAAFYLPRILVNLAEAGESREVRARLVLM